MMTREEYAKILTPYIHRPLSPEEAKSAQLEMLVTQANLLLDIRDQNARIIEQNAHAIDVLRNMQGVLGNMDDKIRAIEGNTAHA